jgi:predicted nucleotide-binding protein
MSFQERDPRKVFVVHGRNLAARDAMYAFLNGIGLRPLEWSATATGKASPYIGEVLDVLFRDAQAVIVLLTPDDEARLLPGFQTLGDPLYETELTPQPRPNVLFEAGLAFGSHPDRTVLVELGKTRQFSDILGRHTVRMSNVVDRRVELAERLRGCGCPVDTTGAHWLRAGDFEQAVSTAGDA